MDLFSSKEILYMVLSDIDSVKIDQPMPANPELTRPMYNIWQFFCKSRTSLLSKVQLASNSIGLHLLALFTSQMQYEEGWKLKSDKDSGSSNSVCSNCSAQISSAFCHLHQFFHGWDSLQLGIFDGPSCSSKGSLPEQGPTHSNKLLGQETPLTASYPTSYTLDCRL